VAWTITSDKRWKSQIQPLTLGVDFIKQLKPVSYFRNNDSSKKIEMGLIAQDLEEVLQKTGIPNSGMITKDDNGMYSVRYNDLFAPMIKAIQEQQTEISSQKDRVNKLEIENQQLKAHQKDLETRLRAIEQKLGY
jgi:trimeric autotransporter adhesin